MATPSRNAEPAPGHQGVLVSWKSIAGYFGCNERTAKRWEERGLPVHRIPGAKRGHVFAYTSELDAWLQAMRSNEAERRSGSAVGSRDEGLQLPADDGILPQSGAGLASVVGFGPFRQDLGSRKWLSWGALSLAIFFIGASTVRILVHRGSALAKPSSGIAASLHVPAPGVEGLYIQGRYFWNLRTADGLSKAINTFTQAIVKDPSYAEAYAGLAESYDLLPEFDNAGLDDALLRAEDAADRAIALDPNLAAAHRAKAFALYFRDWDIAGSDAEFQRALALDPNSAETHQWYASSLQCREEGAAALRQIEEARRLNPVSPAIAAEAAYFQADFGDLGAGIRELKEIEQTQPNLSSPALFLSVIDFAVGDFPGYIAETRRYASITGGPDDVALSDSVAHGWDQGGKVGFLEARAKSLKIAFEHGSEPAGFWLAQTLLMLGRPKAALPYFKASLNSHIVAMTMMQDCPWAKPLMKDPDYAALFAEIRERQHGGYPNHPAVVRVTLQLPN